MFAIGQHVRSTDGTVRGTVAWFGIWNAVFVELADGRRVVLGADQLVGA